MVSFCFADGRHKRFLRLSFLCGGKGDQCLYSKSYFTLDTKLPKPWIHLMFLSTQVKLDTERRIDKRNDLQMKINVEWHKLAEILTISSLFVRPQSVDFFYSQWHDLYQWTTEPCFYMWFCDCSIVFRPKRPRPWVSMTTASVAWRPAGTPSRPTARRGASSPSSPPPSPQPRSESKAQGQTEVNVRIKVSGRVS